jgi:hypothetical protein
MHDKRHATAINLRERGNYQGMAYIINTRAYERPVGATCARRQSMSRAAIICGAMLVSLSKTNANGRVEMGAASTLPDELDTARLFVIEVPEIKTPQCSHIVSPHDALEEPVPITDHA